MPKATLTVLSYEPASDSFFYKLTGWEEPQEITADKAYSIWEEREQMNHATDLEKRLIAEFMSLDFEEPVDLVGKSVAVTI